MAGGARSFFAATIAGIALYVVLDAIAQCPCRRTTVRSARQRTTLPSAPYGYIMAVNFVNRGIYSLLFVYGLARSRLRRAELRTGFGLLRIWAVGALILAASPTDVGGPATAHEFVHLVAATLSFLAAAIGTVSLSRAFQLDPDMEAAGRYAMPLAGLALVFFFVLYGGPLVFPHAAAKVGGLVERAFIGLVLAWMFAVSVFMFNRSNT